MSHLMSQREAARLWGVGRATLQRSIAAGELSVSSEKLIDPAEMLRVFGEAKRPAGPASGRPSEPLGPPAEPPKPDPAQVARIAVLETELAARDRENELLRANLEDLRSQVRLLTHDQAKAPSKRRWWQFGS